MMEKVSKWTWRLWLSNGKDTLGRFDGCSLEIQMEAMIMQSWRLWLTNFREILGSTNWAFLKMHQEAMIKSIWKSTTSKMWFGPESTPKPPWHSGRPHWSSLFIRDALKPPLELSTVLLDSARAFSCAPESTCSYGCAFRTLQYWTYEIVIFWSGWDHCTDWQEPSRAAETSAQVIGRLGAVLSEQWFHSVA